MLQANGDAPHAHACSNRHHGWLFFFHVIEVVILGIHAIHVPIGAKTRASCKYRIFRLIQEDMGTFVLLILQFRLAATKRPARVHEEADETLTAGGDGMKFELALPHKPKTVPDRPARAHRQRPAPATELCPDTQSVLHRLGVGGELWPCCGSRHVADRRPRSRVASRTNRPTRTSWGSRSRCPICELGASGPAAAVDPWREHRSREAEPGRHGDHSMSADFGSGAGGVGDRSGGGVDGGGGGADAWTEATAFAPAQRVKLHGLTSRADLNDSEASIVRWDAKLGRWRVRTDSGACLALKSLNIESLGDSDADFETSAPPRLPSASRTGPSSSVPATDGAARFEPGDLVTVKAAGPKTVRLVLGVSDCGTRIEIRAESVPSAQSKWVAAAKAEPLPEAPSEAVPTEFLFCRVQARDPHAVPAGGRAAADVVDVRIDPAGKLRFQVPTTKPENRNSRPARRQCAPASCRGSGRSPASACATSPRG